MGGKPLESTTYLPRKWACILPAACRKFGFVTTWENKQPQSSATQSAPCWGPTDLGCEPFPPAAVCWCSARPERWQWCHSLSRKPACLGMGCRWWPWSSTGLPPRHTARTARAKTAWHTQQGCVQGLQSQTHLTGMSLRWDLLWRNGMPRLTDPIFQ